MLLKKLSLCRDEIDLRVSEVPVVIFEDNQGAIAMSINPTHYAKTKHIHIRHHFIREQIENGDLVVKYIGTESMLADALTKSLTKIRLDLDKSIFMGCNKL